MSCDGIRSPYLLGCLQISKSKIVFVSFTTLQKKVAFDIDTFISARGKSLANLRIEILSQLPPPPTAAPPANATSLSSSFEILHLKYTCVDANDLQNIF